MGMPLIFSDFAAASTSSRFCWKAIHYQYNISLCLCWKASISVSLLKSHTLPIQHFSVVDTMRQSSEWYLRWGISCSFEELGNSWEWHLQIINLLLKKSGSSHLCILSTIMPSTFEWVLLIVVKGMKTFAICHCLRVFFMVQGLLLNLQYFSIISISKVHPLEHHNSFLYKFPFN